MTLSTRMRVAMLSATLLSAGPLAAADDMEVIKTDKVRVQVETIASGLDHPWAVEVLPDGAYIVTERPGALRDRPQRHDRGTDLRPAEDRGNRSGRAARHRPRSAICHQPHPVFYRHHCRPRRNRHRCLQRTSLPGRKAADGRQAPVPDEPPQWRRAAIRRSHRHSGRWQPVRRPWRPWRDGSRAGFRG